MREQAGGYSGERGEEEGEMENGGAYMYKHRIA